jgi:hypothetical protein
MCCRDLALLVEAETSVVDFVFALVVGDLGLLWNGATDDVGLSFFGEHAQQVSSHCSLVT